MENAVRKIALYARVSTKDKGQDPENQLHILREFAQVQGWKIAHEYVDHVSGKSSDRAQFQQLGSYGVGFRSYSEQYLDSCGIFRDAVLSILATVAKQERILKSDRTKAGLARARREGRIGGRPRLVLDRDRMIRMDEQGYSQQEIAEEL